GGGQPDLLAGIGYGKYSARTVLRKLVPSIAQTEPAGAEEEQTESGSGFTSVIRRVFGTGGADNALKVQGHGELLVYRAKCCNPIRGEEVVGYVTRGKGVAVHSKNCPNVTNLLYESDRRIEVEWGKPVKTPAAAGPA